jgi:hypothetical protein
MSRWVRSYLLMISFEEESFSNSLCTCEGFLLSMLWPHSELLKWSLDVFLCLTLLFLMLLGFHESVFHFSLLETTYVICVKCCRCIPIDSTLFAQFFLLKVNGNLATHLHWRSSCHSSQSATKDSEEREAWISFAINGIVKISRPVSSANS